MSKSDARRSTSGSKSDAQLGSKSGSESESKSKIQDGAKGGNSSEEQQDKGSSQKKPSDLSRGGTHEQHVKAGQQSHKKQLIN